MADEISSGSTMRPTALPHRVYSERYMKEPDEGTHA